MARLDAQPRLRAMIRKLLPCSSIDWRWIQRCCDRQLLSNSVAAFISQADNLRNNRVVVMGSIDSRSDVDMVFIAVVAGETWIIDVDAAEFQYPLDATLRVLSASGVVLATNLEGLDRESGSTQSIHT